MLNTQGRRQVGIMVLCFPHVSPHRPISFQQQGVTVRRSAEGLGTHTLLRLYPSVSP